MRNGEIDDERFFRPGTEANSDGDEAWFIGEVGMSIDHMVTMGRFAGLLVLSNVFMTFAWYGHLKHLGHKPWWMAALVSWAIAGVEYAFQVPANRVGAEVLSLGQLKIAQEVITLSVFVPFAVLYMNQPLKLDYLWAGLCLLAAVYFIFRSS